MSTGTFITIIEKTAFEFSYLPLGLSETRTVQRAVNTIPWYYGTLYANIHAFRVGTGAAATVSGKIVNPSTTDQQSFVKSGAGVISLTLTGASAPSLLDAVASAALGPYLQFDVTGTQSSSTVTYIYFEISLHLLLRSN